MSNVRLVIDVDTIQAQANLRSLSGAVDNFDRSLDQGEGALRMFEKGLGSFRRAVLGVQAALAGWGLSKLISDLIKVNMEFESVRMALIAGSDNMRVAAADFAWVRQEAVKLGMPLNKIGFEYAKLTAAAKGTALQGQPVRDIFSSVGRASVAMGLDISQTQRIFMSLTQMMSKGRVQAEEARQQFGEHLPGGFRALAKAAGFDAVTGIGKFTEALKKGQVDAVTMLNKLPAVLDEMFGPAFQAAMTQSPQLAVNQFKAIMANLMYDLGQKGGFMREFAGMIRDLVLILSSPDGVDGVNKLADALGMLMKVVRGAVSVIAKNLDTVIATFASLTSGAIVIAIKGFIGWMGRLAGAATMGAALTNPWILLAAAIAGAVYFLFKFNSELISVGSYSATLTEWAIAGFGLISEKIFEAQKRLESFILKVPVLGAVVKATGDAIAKFQSSRTEGKDIATSARDGMSSFGEVFKKSVSPEIYNNIVGFLRDVQTMAGQAWMAVKSLAVGMKAGLTNAFEEVKARIGPVLNLLKGLGGLVLGAAHVAWEGLKDLFSRLPAIAVGLGAVFTSLGTAVGITFGSIASNIAQGFSNIAAAIIPLLQTIWSSLQKLAGTNFFQSMAVAAAVAGGIIINTFLGVANGVGVAFRLATELFRIFAESLEPILAPVINVVGQLLQIVVGLIAAVFNPQGVGDTWTRFIGVVSAVYDYVGDVVSRTFAFIHLVAGIVGPIIDAISNVITGVVSLVQSVIATFTHSVATANQTAAEKTVENAKKSQTGWINAGDVIIGVFLTVIRVVGLLIQAIATLLGAIIELAGRAAEVFSGVSDGLGDIFTLDFKGAQEAGSRLGKAFTDPLKADFQGLGEDIKTNWTVITTGQDFNVISNAADTYNNTQSAFDKAKADFGAGFRTFDISGSEAMTANAAAGGKSAAESWFSGFFNEWGQRSDAAHKAAVAEAERLRLEQEALAKTNADAWNQMNNNVDRSVRPDQLESANKKKKGGKTVAERAQDMVDDLKAALATDTKLAVEIGLNPYVDPMSIKAVEKAQDALKRAGYEMTYADSQSAGGMPKELADIAFKASIAEQQLNRAKAAQEAFGQNTQQIAALKDQINLTQDLTMSSSEYEAQMAAQSALRSKDFQLTYQQAMATDQFGKAINPVAKALAESAYSLELWTQKAKAAVAVTSNLRSYTQLRTEIGLLSAAELQSQDAVNKASAEIYAQHVVMSAYGDAVFNATRLNDENTRSMYEQAKAYAMLGGSATAYAETVRSINDTSLERTDPYALKKLQIERNATNQQGILDSGFAAQTQQYNQTNSISSIMGMVDEGLTPEDIDTRLKQSTDQWMAARQAYQDASSKLVANTQDDIIKNSNTLQGAWESSWADFQKSAEDVAGQMKKVFDDVFQGLTNVLTEFVMTGKADFASFARSIIADITAIIVKMMVMQTVKMIVGMFDKGGVMTSSGPTNASYGSIQTFAKGGIMSGSGSLPLHAYSSGGVATTPQLALYGEGRQPEAYVPLPDGRTIPVTMTMMGGGGSNAVDMASTTAMLADAMNGMSRAVAGGVIAGFAMSDRSEGSSSSAAPVIHIESNVTVEGGGGGGQGGSPGMDSKTMAALSKQISMQIRSEVVSVMQNETRPGGAFNRMGGQRGKF